MRLRRTTPLILAVALFIEQMDSTVIATSLPAIAADTRHLAGGVEARGHLVPGGAGGLRPISGWMSDRFGAKNIFRLAILVFMAGSVACAFSGSIHAFVLARLPARASAGR